MPCTTEETSFICPTLLEALPLQTGTPVKVEEQRSVCKKSVCPGLPGAGPAQSCFHEFAHLTLMFKQDITSKLLFSAAQAGSHRSQEFGWLDISAIPFANFTSHFSSPSYFTCI